MATIPSGRRLAIPLWLKIVYSLFVCILVPTYWRTYGPANFMWYCDFATLVTAVALWLESPLLASMEAVAMTVSQIVWISDFIAGGHFVGFSTYMFQSGIPAFVRGLSTFHLWLPVLLIWLVWRLGYDRRAFLAQCVVSTALLAACYLLTDPAHPPAGYPDAAVNVNRVYGLDPTHVQHAIPPMLYLLIEATFFAVCVFLPAHLVFRRIFPTPDSVARARAIARIESSSAPSVA
jgi:hypothetical protein